MTNTSILTDNELNAVSGGEFEVRFRVGGARVNISVQDGPNGPIVVGQIRGSDGRGTSTTTIPM